MGFGASRAYAAERTADVKEIFELNKAIDAKQDRLEELQRDIDRHRQNIRAEQGRARTLQQRIAILEERVAKQQLEIERVRTERERIVLEIEATRLSLTQARNRIAKRRALLTAVLTELRAAEGRPTLHIVLASASIGEAFAQRARTMQLQDGVRRILADVRRERESLEESERTLVHREEELRELDDRLREERVTLEEEQGAKERLLSTTKRNEQRYQQLVSELKAEVAATDTEIVALESRVREKLTAIDAQFGQLGRVAFSWPVPNRGITTRFYDPEYPFRYIFEHPGLDIRASQGSTITAPAPGYVAKVKDAGYGYSYLMLIHPGGFSTVYGHVSCSKAEEGTYVTRGQPIACVGGTPGTRGAGRLTTGAHLHFEIRLNGIPADPLNYLL